jgi:hypothetical protein
MILRIVKLAIQKGNQDLFWAMFEQKKETIRRFEGCLNVNAYPDTQLKYIFTVSEWKDQSYLEAYRESDFFEETWTETKKLFYDRPEAWSLVKK